MEQLHTGGRIELGPDGVTEDIFARISVLNAALFSVGKYKKGQILSINEDGEFAPFDDEVVDAICVNDIEITAAQKYAAVAKGEFSLKGVTVVNAALATPVTVNDKIRTLAFKNNVILN